MGVAVFRQAQRREEILAEHFTGVDGGVFLHRVLPVIIGDDQFLLRRFEPASSRYLIEQAEYQKQ